MGGINPTKQREEEELLRIQRIENRVWERKAETPDIKWTDERLKQLNALYRKGLRGTAIAAQMDLPYQSVITKMRKLGLLLRNRGKAAVLLCLLASPAQANSDLILQDIRQLNLNRPISVVVTENAYTFCTALQEVDHRNGERTTHQDVYACASAAYGQGRCTVWIRPDRLAYLYHELQHCAGITHTPEGD